MPQLGDPDSDIKSPLSAMTYKSSFQLLELARSRTRRLTASNSRQSLNVVSPTRASLEVGNPELNEVRRQASVLVDQTMSNNQIMRMAPTGPDPTVIMRDSRTTQAILLKRRKAMLGQAIQLEQNELASVSREFERAPNRHNGEYRARMVRHAEHIYELGARRKLINRCLRFLGVDPDDASGVGVLDDEGTFDLDRDTQQVENLLASLYRHRCLIYSGYLIWTSQVRDILMRFLYMQDCLSAIEYYMSEAATKVARTAASDRERDRAGWEDTSDKSTKRRSRQRRDTRASTRTAKHPDEFMSLPISESPRNTGVTAKSPASKHSDARSIFSDTSRRTRNFPNLLRKLRSHDKIEIETESSKPKTGKPASSSRWSRSQPGKHHNKKKRKEDFKPSKEKTADNKFEKGLRKFWDDFSHYHAYYSFLVEFLNSQVSLRVDEKTSTSSVIAVAERVQLHRILLSNSDEFNDKMAMDGMAPGGRQIMRPPDDESIVKTRSLVEIENIQVFTASRDDFVGQAEYFVDCTYGSRIGGDAARNKQPDAIWPAWIPIEILLSQGKHKARGIFDDLDHENEHENRLAEAQLENEYYSDSSDSSFMSVGSSTSSQRQATRQGRRKKGKSGRAWWLQDLSKYKRLMDRNNGLLVYDKANPHRILGDNTDHFDFSIEDISDEAGSKA
ncbi:Protein SABRE, partial [Linderina pennispora]